MTHDTSSIGRGQQEWLGKRSKMEPIDSRHEGKLGCARCLVWGFAFEEDSVSPLLRVGACGLAFVDRPL
jgi:hypothetical protein